MAHEIHDLPFEYGLVVLGRGQRKPRELTVREIHPMPLRRASPGELKPLLTATRRWGASGPQHGTFRTLDGVIRRSVDGLDRNPLDLTSALALVKGRSLAGAGSSAPSFEQATRDIPKPLRITWSNREERLAEASVLHGHDYVVVGDGLQVAQVHEPHWVVSHQRGSGVSVHFHAGPAVPGTACFRADHRAEAAAFAKEWATMARVIVSFHDDDVTVHDPEGLRFDSILAVGGAVVRLVKANQTVLRTTWFFPWTTRAMGSAVRATLEILDAEPEMVDAIHASRVLDTLARLVSLASGEHEGVKAAMRPLLLEASMLAHWWTEHVRPSRPDLTASLDDEPEILAFLSP